jgi:ABC-2 type transport system ATP-binding protein
MPPTEAIHADGLTKYFGQVVGVEDLSLSVAPGEVFGFLGPNGAGKTTTIRLLLDLLRPSRGRASVLGFDCHRDGLLARQHVGYLPGELPVYHDLSAGGHLRHLARLQPEPVSESRLRLLLRRFDVSDLDLARRLRDQSHGMKRKIGILQALMGEPPVLVLDEPTGGLDPLMIEAFLETLDELKRGGRTTVFLSSHVLSEVERSCDRIGLIRAGRLVAVRQMRELQQLAPRRVTLDFKEPVSGEGLELPQATLVEAGSRQWVLEVRGPLGPVLAALAHLPVHDLQVEPFKLEHYVLQLYSGD